MEDSCLRLLAGTACGHAAMVRDAGRSRPQEAGPRESRLWLALLRRSTAPLKRVREENYCEKFLRFRAEGPSLARPMTRSRIHQLVTDKLSCSSCENQMFPQLSAS